MATSGEPTDNRLLAQRDAMANFVESANAEWGEPTKRERARARSIITTDPADMSKLGAPHVEF